MHKKYAQLAIEQTDEGGGRKQRSGDDARKVVCSRCFAIAYSFTVVCSTINRLAVVIERTTEGKKQRSGDAQKIRSTRRYPTDEKKKGVKKRQQQCAESTHSQKNELCQ